MWSQVFAASFLVTLGAASPSGVDLTMCTPSSESNFNIQLLDMGNEPAPARFVEAFEKAAERWQKVIVGDVQGFPAGVVQDWFGGSFSKPFNGAVDDLVIGYEVSNGWDGVGGTLGQAGGLFVRPATSSNPKATISGIMKFDLADFERLPESDASSIITHEMGHGKARMKTWQASLSHSALKSVLGLVGTNGDCTSACNPNVPSQRFEYECDRALEEYEALAPGSLFLENNGGTGTACGHWDEAVFRTGESSELMTGFFEANRFQPLSLVTVAAIEDLGGYQVDYCGADIWPSDESTIQRFEVFRTSQNIDTEGMMSMGPAVEFDDTGPVDVGSSVPCRTLGLVLVGILALLQALM